MCLQGDDVKEGRRGRVGEERGRGRRRRKGEKGAGEVGVWGGVGWNECVRAVEQPGAEHKDWGGACGEDNDRQGEGEKSRRAGDEGRRRGRTLQAG